MKCYYEVLDIPRDADDATIKAAYKKQALRWHPDKNLDNQEEAKDKFQLVQQAYEVLSDRQERAWYDGHREQILISSSDQVFENINLFQYFIASCYRGYGDDEKGFYTVYRNVFDKIAEEDLQHSNFKGESLTVPSFGTSQSDYEAVVGPFYAYWSNYSTKKSFAWLDPHSIVGIRVNKILKLIEKENKKVRDKAKKEWNEEVRSLVAFVRKRDKRVKVQRELEEAKRIENRKKHKQIGLQKRLERQMELNNSKERGEWAKFDDVQSELEQIERDIAKEFGEVLSDSEESHESCKDNLYCIACNKIFKTEKAFQNHESSKKHKENFARMSEEMLTQDLLSEQTEDASSIDDNSEDSGDPVKDFLDPDDQDSENCPERVDENVCEEIDDFSKGEAGKNELGPEDKPTNKKSKRKQKNKQNILDTPDEEPIEIAVDKDSDSGFDFSSSNKKQKKKLSKKQNNKNEGSKSSKKDIEEIPTVAKNNEEQPIEAENVDDIPNNVGPDRSKENEKRQKKNAKKIVKQGQNISKKDDISEIDINHCCVTCKSTFSSKNKLFDHLKKAGHGLYLQPVVVKNKSKKNKNKER